MGLAGQQVAQAFDLLADHLEILFNGHKTGILLQLLNACRRCKTRESECAAKLLDIFQHTLQIENRGDDFNSEIVNKALNIQKEGGHVLWLGSLLDL